jgi:hypothetical protein
LGDFGASPKKCAKILSISPIIREADPLNSSCPASDSEIVMSTVYLFQIDGAENNNTFFSELVKTLDSSGSFSKGLR